jgi:hypothetical protein
MQATAPPAEGTPEDAELHEKYLANWHEFFRKEARQRKRDVNSSLGNEHQSRPDPNNPTHFGGRKSRRHSKKSRRHGKKSRRHAKKSRRHGKSRR